MNDISLDTLVAQINRHFEHLEQAGPDYADRRISIGQLFIAARGRIESGKWHAWLKANINRSIRDCQRAIALAHAPDPHQHLAHQREKNRQQVRRYRQRLRELRGGLDDAGWLSQIRDRDPPMQPTMLQLPIGREAK